MVWFKDESHHQLQPAEMTMKWDKYNLTMDENAKVRVSLWGYREDSVLPKLEYIDMIYVRTLGQANKIPNKN